jgi:hypothetical protein
MKTPPTDNINLRQELERRIVHGLSCEWENACGMLSSRDRNRFKPPLFSLRDMTSRLGYWSNEKNEIVISRSLAMNFPWDDVREVLFHEMAHQYAEQILGAGDEPPHGPIFKKACRRLRANPKASGRFKPLHESLRDSAVSENDRILMRVKKLLSLAESSNRHEAEAAMSKAHALIKKYNVDLVKKTPRRNFISMFVGKPALRHPREVYYLANLLQTFYFIQGIWVSAYVLDKGKMGRVFEVSGTTQNVNMASYVYDFVMNFIQQHWHQYNGLKGLNRHRQTDFAVGIIEGFSNKLSQGEAKDNTPASSDALVAVKDPMLKKYMTHRYPHTRSFRRTASTQDDRVLKDGYRIGKKMVISKGIAHKKKSDRRIAYYEPDRN